MTPTEIVDFCVRYNVTIHIAPTRAVCCQSYRPPKPGERGGEVAVVTTNWEGDLEAAVREHCGKVMA